MSVKIISEENKLLGAEGVTRKDIRKMTDKCRADHKGILKWSHFEISEILNFLVANGVIETKDTVEYIITNVNNRGIKIFIGKHLSNTIPPGRQDYVDHSTTILCTTTKNTNKKWICDLDENYEVCGLADNKGNGLDKTLICEPDCTSGDDV